MNEQFINPIIYTKTYKKLVELQEYIDRKKNDIEELKKITTNEKIKENIKIMEKDYRRINFIKTFIVMCEMACREEDPIFRKNFVRDIIGTVIVEITKNHEEIPDLRNLFEKYKKDDTKHDTDDKKAEWSFRDDYERFKKNIRRGRPFVRETPLIDKFIKNMDKKVENNEEYNSEKHDLKYMPLEDSPHHKTLEDFARGEFARIYEISRAEAESIIQWGRVPTTTLINILYGLIFRVMLKMVFENEFTLHSFEDIDTFKGDSGVLHSFSGHINFGEKRFLVNAVALYQAHIEALERIKSELEDLNMRRCLLFIPIYPSQTGLNFENNLRKKYEVYVFYLHDLYKMIDIWDKNKIREFIMAKVRD